MCPQEQVKPIATCVQPWMLLQDILAAQGQADAQAVLVHQADGGPLHIKAVSLRRAGTKLTANHVLLTAGCCHTPRQLAVEERLRGQQQRAAAHCGGQLDQACV